MPIVLSDPRPTRQPLVFANQAFLAMTGYDADADHRPPTVVSCKVQAPIRPSSRGSHGHCRAPRFRDRDPELPQGRLCLLNALFVSAVYDAAGELVYFFAFAARRHAPREAEDNLRQSQKMEALGQLTGGIAHDFNNLLQVMVGYLELIDAGLSKPEINTPKLKRNIDNARAAADRAAALTQQLLSFSAQAAARGPHPQPERPRALHARARRPHSRQDVAIELRLADDLANCRLDSTQIETALLNIMINAREAMAKPQGQAARHRDPQHRHRTGRGVQGQEPAGGHYVSVESRTPATAFDGDHRARDGSLLHHQGGKARHRARPLHGLRLRQAVRRRRWITRRRVGTTVSMYFPAVSEPCPAARPTREWRLTAPATRPSWWWRTAATSPRWHARSSTNSATL